MSKRLKDEGEKLASKRDVVVIVRNMAKRDHDFRNTIITAVNDAWEARERVKREGRLVNRLLRSLRRFAGR